MYWAYLEFTFAEAVMINNHTYFRWLAYQPAVAASCSRVWVWFHAALPPLLWLAGLHCQPVVALSLSLWHISASNHKQSTAALMSLSMSYSPSAAVAQTEMLIGNRDHFALLHICLAACQVITRASMLDVHVSVAS